MVTNLTQYSQVQAPLPDGWLPICRRCIDTAGKTDYRYLSLSKWWTIALADLPPADKQAPITHSLNPSTDSNLTIRARLLFLRESLSPRGPKIKNSRNLCNAAERLEFFALIKTEGGIGELQEVGGSRDSIIAPSCYSPKVLPTDMKGSKAVKHLRWCLCYNTKLYCYFMSTRYKRYIWLCRSISLKFLSTTN